MIRTVCGISLRDMIAYRRERIGDEMIGRLSSRLMDNLSTGSPVDFLVRTGEGKFVLWDRAIPGVPDYLTEPLQTPTFCQPSAANRKTDPNWPEMIKSVM